MKELKILFQKNKKWIAAKTEDNPNFFKESAKLQEPKYLWIGCSDSRVPANEIVGLDAGELFVHRNIGNLFLHSDLNCLAVLDYAVNVLKVRHVILCGHYGCGAIQLAMEKPGQGIAEHWLCNIRDLYLQHQEELDTISNLQERQNRLAEWNIKQQVFNICHSPVIQKAWQIKQPLWIHGWVYDLCTGLLKDLELCFSNIDQVKNLYHA